jgi:hypothetical protein
MSIDLPNISQNNEQILNDIQSMQQMEQQLFSTLETNTSLSSTQQSEIVDKINQVSNMRVNLYQTLNNVNNFYDKALSSSIGTLKEQTAAISIVEQELNRSKQRLELLEAEKNNKIRLVEINDYFSDKYAEHTKLMKIIIFTLIPVIILAVLNNKGFLPNSFFYILLSIVVVIGSIFFWFKMGSIMMRDNMNYQEYNWYFNPNSATTTNTTTSSSDPWFTSNLPGTCVGQYCCSDGQTYDSSLNQCVISSSVTETFVNNILSKTSHMLKPFSPSSSSSPSSTLNKKQIQPFISESFISYRSIK